MGTQELVPFRLENISSKAYEHPADRAATAALQSIPKLDVVVRKLIELQYERALRQVLLASSVKLGPDQLGDVWACYEHAHSTLDMPGAYDLYVSQYPIANASTIGARQPTIVLSSAVVSLLEPDELRTIVAHELGHILSDHVVYTTALQILLRLGTARLPWAAGLPLRAITAALLEWYRAAELSCDRAATLANRDPLVTCRTLMSLAAGRRSRDLNLEAFLRQANEYEGWDSGWDKMRRLLIELSLDHDFPVRRCSELMRWVRSGDYGRIVGGDYPTRDQPPDPRGAASDAADHYARRFRRFVEEAGEEITRTGERLVEWLDRTGR